MKLTIKDYCSKKGIGVRYIQKIIKDGNNRLLKDNWGILSYEKVGNTYLLNVSKK